MAEVPAQRVCSGKPDRSSANCKACSAHKCRREDKTTQGAATLANLHFFQYQNLVARRIVARGPRNLAMTKVSARSSGSNVFARTFRISGAFGSGIIQIRHRRSIQDGPRTMAIRGAARREARQRSPMMVFVLQRKPRMNQAPKQLRRCS